MALAGRLARWLFRTPSLVDARFRLDRRLNRLRGTADQRQVFAIGIVSGPDLSHLSAPSGVVNPVVHAGMVSDMDAGFVADPFWIRRGDEWWMFFEVMNRHARRGQIACAKSSDGLHWAYCGRVLQERFHLSYPQVFAHNGAYYMIPESWETGSVRLYRAESFPFGWVLDTVLLERPYCDSTIFEHDGLWWMLCTPGETLRNDELHVFWSKSLRGKWTPHPRNPVLTASPDRARPAGRVAVVSGAMFRFAQSCLPFYGSSVHAYRITQLSPTDYAEEATSQSPVLNGSGHGWNGCGMHHVDLREDGRGGWIACVDGWSSEVLSTDDAEHRSCQ